MCGIASGRSYIRANEHKGDWSGIALRYNNVVSNGTARYQPQPAHSIWDTQSDSQRYRLYKYNRRCRVLESTNRAARKRRNALVAARING